MILKLYQENLFKEQLNKWWFISETTGDVIAIAANGQCFHTQMIYNNKNYCFKNRPILIKRKELNFKYPYSSKREWAIGFGVYENGTRVMTNHWDALQCEERGLNKNIGLNVIDYNEKSYMLFGMNDAFCLYDNDGNLIAIIKRWDSDTMEENLMATLYIKDEKDIPITMLACVSKIVDCINYLSKGENIDPWPGKSLLKEENELYDKEFIEMVKKKVPSSVNTQFEFLPKFELKDILGLEQWERYEKHTKMGQKIMIVAFFVVAIMGTIIYWLPFYN